MLEVDKVQSYSEVTRASRNADIGRFREPSCLS
jgi:hypothetical protein